MRASASNANSNASAPLSASGRGTAQRSAEAATGSEALPSPVAGSADTGAGINADGGGPEQQFSSALAAVRAAGARRSGAPAGKAASISELVDPRASGEAVGSATTTGNGVPESAAINAPDSGRRPTAMRHGKPATDIPKHIDVAPLAMPMLPYSPPPQSAAVPSVAVTAVGGDITSATGTGAAISGGAISGAAVIDDEFVGAAVAGAVGGASSLAGSAASAPAQASSEGSARSPRTTRDASAERSYAAAPVATAGSGELAARVSGAQVVTAESLSGRDTSLAASHEAARDATHDAGRDTASGNGGSGARAALLAPSLPAPVPSATPIAPPSAAAAQTLGTPVSDPGWPHALAAQIQWMASRQMHSATLRLSPEHLGPLEVRIEVAHAQVNVNFSAHHADTREALAQAVPRLRELFAGSGLNLGQATVQQEPRSSGQSPQDRLVQPQLANKTVEPVANTVVHRLGLIDEYA